LASGAAATSGSPPATICLRVNLAMAKPSFSLH
jgi:hypothetical protein